MSHSIDFNSHIPYYAQLIDLIKEQIDQHVWKPGDRIPGEPELCKEYGISRTVVRQALLELEQDGLIVRRKGKGTFVAFPKIGESLAQKLTGFYQDMLERGIQPVTQVLKQELVPANPKIAEFLQIDPGSEVIEVRRLRFVNEEPIQLVYSYLPCALCPKLAEVDLTNRSLYGFLESECGLFISHGRRFIEAMLAPEAEARLLRVERGAPLIMLESIAYLEDGRPVEYYKAFHRGDRSRFEIELVRVKEQSKLAEKLGSSAGEFPSSNAFIR